MPLATSSREGKVRAPGAPVLAAALLLLLAVLSCSSNRGRLAYVATGEGVFAYRINRHSGAASAVLGSPFVAKTSATTATSLAGIAVHSSDRFLYVTNQSDNTISKFTIDSLSGALTEMLPRTTTGLAPGPILLDSSGSFLFVADQVSNDVSVFSVGSNGALSPVSNASVGSTPSGLALPSSGNFLFVAVPNFSAVYAFSVSSGSLSAVPGSPFLLTSGVASAAIDPQGRFLYVPNPPQNTVSGFAIRAGGSLSPIPGSPFAAGTTPVAAGVDPSGSFLYVANSGSTSLSQYTIDSSSGALTAITKTTATVGSNPRFLVFDPGAKILYVGNIGSRSISELTINSDGSLSSTGNTIPLSSVPQALALTK